MKSYQRKERTVLYRTLQHVRTERHIHTHNYYKQKIQKDIKFYAAVEPPERLYPSLTGRALID